MTFCTGCGAELPVGNDFCGKCGARRLSARLSGPLLRPTPVRRSTSPLAIVFLSIIGAVGILAVIVYLNPADPSADQSTPAAIVAPTVEGTPEGEELIAGNHQLGCVDRDFFEQLMNYVRENDNEAFKAALAGGLLSGQCVAFRDKEIVFVEDRAILSGLIKIRRKGQMAAYWTTVEAASP